MEDLKQRKNRVLALGGIVLASSLAKQLAWKGTTNADEFATCIYSIFQTHAPTVAAVYGEERKIQSGLRILKTLLSAKKAPKDMELARYTMSLIVLERMLAKNAKKLNALQKGVDRARSQAVHFSDTHENVINNLASIYSENISTFKYRIHVNGDSLFVSQASIVNKIRAVLLGGIRSAVLWRQLGGSRMHLAFGKKTLLQDIDTVLEDISIHSHEYKTT